MTSEISDRVFEFHVRWDVADSEFSPGVLDNLRRDYEGFDTRAAAGVAARQAYYKREFSAGSYDAWVWDPQWGPE